tara:strand:- start:197 stop:307 length:111 start_codon:yes stop_codon:yes gene_type:complete
MDYPSTCGTNDMGIQKVLQELNEKIAHSLCEKKELL